MLIDYAEEYCPVCWVDNDEAVLMDRPSPRLFECRKNRTHYKGGNPKETYKFLLTRKMNEKTPVK